MTTNRVVYNTEDRRILTNITKGNNSKRREVVLTFDDGPSKYLELFLDVLKEEEVRAHFFWEARLLHHKRPWKRVLEEGHQIGTHGHRHYNLTKFTLDRQIVELKKSIKAIEQITSNKVHYFRPPFGQYNEDTIKAAQNLGLQTVLWEIASLDWELKEKPSQIIDNVVDYLQDGAIILLHELQQTLEVLPDLIKEIKKAGYSFRTLN
ncbi:polysaccharide deacetylase family protein [Bacillus sp. JCM 19034]|uniref:polysaccharide deacetylase family protein n=1 Tax=Bacillus sp. JCM 19034 TaxID=1481928 RepID=UPI0009EAF76B|nr:polysaccharide deacetylase family protein [Bacillus sp. JCM 19034]